MKTNLFTKQSFTAIASVLMAAILGVTSLAMVPTPALAASVAQPATPAAQTGNRGDATLERLLERENSWLLTQQANLEKAAAVAEKGQTLIDKAKAKGIDVTDLQNALDAFNRQINQANQDHKNAAGVLAAHQGFDGNGKVTDRTAAVQTLKDARNSLLDAHLQLVQAVSSLRIAIRTWRSTHKNPTK